MCFEIEGEKVRKEKEISLQSPNQEADSLMLLHTKPIDISNAVFIK